MSMRAAGYLSARAPDSPPGVECDQLKISDSESILSSGNPAGPQTREPGVWSIIAEEEDL